MTARPQNRLRSLFAMLCLVAVVLLYAPLGGAAWSLYSSACCTSGAECPIHGHRHAQVPARSDNAMDCGHDMPAMTQCSMSCCHNPDSPALAPVIFVLPAPFGASAAIGSEALVLAPGPQNTFYSIEPLSPPPRISLLAA